MRNTKQSLSSLANLMVFAAGALFLVAPAQAASNAEGQLTWLTDFDAAKAEAKAQSKPILVDFTGSDWCGWCIRLDKEVFSQQAFQEYATENLILLEIDFPRKKKLSDELKAQNKALAKKYGVRGFPTILLVDAEGKVIQKTGYKRGGAAKYVEHLKGLLSE